MPPPSDAVERDTRFHITLSSDLKKQLAILARKNLRSMNAELTIALREYVEQHENS